jgi:predicted metal-dependent enzyme (double-stranded beta helix superfamily)
METEEGIPGILALQRAMVDRLEALTDRVEAQSEIIQRLVDLMNEPASSELSDTLRQLAAVVGQLVERLAAIPHDVVDELQRRVAK